MKTNFLAAVTMLLAVSLLAAAKIGLGFSGGLSAAETRNLAALRHAGLAGDQSQVDIMRNIIKNPYTTNGHTVGSSVDELLVTTALRSLTRLGVAAAIPDINLLAAKTKQNYPDLANYAVVQEARLKAKQEVGTNPDLSLQIAKLYHILGSTPSAINTGVSNYKTQYFASPEGRRLPLPIEVYTMRELADMAYQNHAQDFMSLPGVAQVDFSLDYPSALKIRLAPLSDEARSNALIDSLMHTRVLGPDEEYLMQLLADEGPAASQAIAERLGEVKKNWGRYRETNISALFRVLGMIGDPNQSSVVAQFQSDSDINVRHEAEAESRELRSGVSWLIPSTVGY